MIASVIIPAYNAEQTLGSCLEGLGNQSASSERYEVIVVDDGSVDRSAEVAKRYPVRYLHQSNRGPACARNAGVREASGDVLLFTDADCVPDHEWIVEMLKPFENAEVSGVKGAYRTRQREMAARFAQAEFEDRYDLLLKSPSIDMVDTYSAGFRREVFLEAGGFDESFPVANNEDTDLSYRLVTAGHRLVFAPDALVYHLHPASLTRYLRIKFWRGYWRLVVYRRYPQKAVKDSYTPAVIKIQTLLMALSFALVPIACLRPWFALAPLLLWCLILFSSLPFAAKAFRKDPAVGLLAPLVVWMRAAVFAAGSLSGVAGTLWTSRRRGQDGPVSE